MIEHEELVFDESLLEDLQSETFISCNCDVTVHFYECKDTRAVLSVSLVTRRAGLTLNRKALIKKLSKRMFITYYANSEGGEDYIRRDNTLVVFKGKSPDILGGHWPGYKPFHYFEKSETFADGAPIRNIDCSKGLRKGAKILILFKSPFTKAFYRLFQ